MTDAGMTGDYDSIIGMQKEEPLRRFTTGIPSGGSEPAQGVAMLSGAAGETDDATGLALRIAPVRIGGRLAGAAGVLGWAGTIVISAPMMVYSRRSQFMMGGP
jgi:calcineurin-like phosphoesterase